MTDANKRGDTADRLREVAVLVALRTGLLKKCLIHDEIYDPGQHDYQGALMVAAYLINQSDPLVAPFDGDRTPLNALLKSICTSHTVGCSQCRQIAVSRAAEQGTHLSAAKQPNGPSNGELPQ